jgi:hypothetical protein
MRAHLAFFLALLLAGCGQPVPLDKAAYIGRWEAPQMSLLITADGNVRYRRIEGGTSKSVTGPLKGFKGNNFEVGVGPITTTFVVTAPPRREGNAMKMTVDGVELTRQEDPGLRAGASASA